MKPPEVPDRSRIEWLAVTSLAVIGAVLRLWPIGRLGLTHFDEGIYAASASWSLHPQGLSSLSPELISYAPPGYPILGGLAYWLLGRSDVAMIAVSQVAGVLTIPVVAWLARRTFGPGSGFAAATFCAFSGPHIAFSRMALTDASFLLAWLLAIGAGMRFLEKPGVWRAVLMGLSVGLAQEFKYNGWLVGGMVLASALLGIGLHLEERKLGSILRTLGWGLLSIVASWAVVWPWFRFVEAHGGYSALLRHQQSYLGGWKDWWPHFQIQCDQSVAMLGDHGSLWLVSLVVVSLTPWVARPRIWVEISLGWSRFRRGASLLAIGIILGVAAGPFVFAPYWLGLVMAPWLLTWPGRSARLLGVSWLLLIVTSPFYHPYARLWLPFQATNWLLMGWLVANGFSISRTIRPEASMATADLSRYRFKFLPRYLLVITLLGVGFWPFLSTLRRKAQPQPDLLESSESLYRGSMNVAAILPDEVKGLRILARRPVAYYLAGRVPLGLLAGSADLLGPGDGRTWVLVDYAILRSELGPPSGDSKRNLLDRFAKNWEIVEEFPTTMSLPTTLDLDPAAARSDSPDRSSPLWLLRPRRTRPLR